MKLRDLIDTTDGMRRIGWCVPWWEGAGIVVLTTEIVIGGLNIRGWMDPLQWGLCIEDHWPNTFERTSEYGIQSHSAIIRVGPFHLNISWTKA